MRPIPLTPDPLAVMPMLEVHQLSKDFDGLRAVDAVSFSLAGAEIVGLIGPNGSGKSTLFNLLAGVTPPSSGAIFFNGQDITGLPAHAVARLGMARTFQLVRPFLQLSVRENVEAGLLFGAGHAHIHGDLQAQVRQVLARVGLVDKMDLRAAQLSVVERKWLEIARALAGQPKLLLLDEFMAGLSTAEIPRALNLIRSVRESGIAIILVEHIVKAITSVCERVIVLNAGRKLAEGRVAQIVNDPAVIDAYLGSRHA